jgi:hypothetical protein
MVRLFLKLFIAQIDTQTTYKYIFFNPIKYEDELIRTLYNSKNII